jgi:hypothetical protein
VTDLIDFYVREVEQMTGSPDFQLIETGEGSIAGTFAEQNAGNGLKTKSVSRFLQRLCVHDYVNNRVCFILEEGKCFF